MAVLVLVETIGAVPFMVRSCLDDVARQEQNAVKHQLQASNGGTR